jgi:hypothetical protein
MEKLPKEDNCSLVDRSRIHGTLDAVKQTMWLRELLTELVIELNGPTGLRKTIKNAWP